MKKEIADIWVKALRSGEYKQGTHCLGRISDNSENPSYCCLGVLCMLANLKPEKSGIEGMLVFNHETHFLPEEVQKWAGIETYNASFPNPENTERGSFYSLVDLNDNDYTFLQIADYIEQHWERL